MPRIVAALLILISVSSIAALSWVLARPTPADPRVAALESELDSARKELTRLREQLAQRPGLPASGGTAAAAAPAGADPSAALAGGLAGAPQRPATASGNRREVLATPGMRAMLEQQQTMQIEMGYGRLFEVLQLNPEETAHLKNLLLEREKTQTDMALKMMDPNITQEQRAALVKEMKEHREKYAETIRAFMNNEEDYKTFKSWEETQPERVSFDMMGRTLFSQSSEPLSQQQEQELINLMAEVRRTPSTTPDITDPANYDPRTMTDAAVQEQLQRLEKNDQAVLQRASQFLTPAQLQTLQAYQQQVRNMAATGMQMSKALMNSGGTGAP